MATLNPSFPLPVAAFLIK
uniref:Uncharacterized protein n=1 Tax=Rhizophora mucronata TaxID=61149 RepID=A0A2P2IWI3_RHIMU